MARGRVREPIGLAHALKTFRDNRDSIHRSDPRRLIAQDELDAAAALIAQLATALAPLETLNAGTHPLASLAQCHRDVIAALSQDGKGDIAGFCRP